MAIVWPDRQKHGEKRSTTSGLRPPDASATEEMRHKRRTAEGPAVYKLRKAVVEPVFGQINDRILRTWEPATTTSSLNQYQRRCYPHEGHCREASDWLRKVLTLQEFKIPRG